MCFISLKSQCGSLLSLAQLRKWYAQAHILMGRGDNAPSPPFPGLPYVQEEEITVNIVLLPAKQPDGAAQVMIEKEYAEYILAFAKEETSRNKKWPRLMTWCVNGLLL